MFLFEVFPFGGNNEPGNATFQNRDRTEITIPYGGLRDMKSGKVGDDLVGRIFA